MEAAFYENFIETAGEVTPELDDVPRELRPGTARRSLVRSSPTGGSNDLKRLYLLAIAAARATLDITSPYFVTDESSDWSLERRRRTRRQGPHPRRGGHHRRDAGEVRLARRPTSDLLALGIEIYEYQPTMMHTKTLVVDGAWSMFGSANFDNRSLELNDELNVAVAIRDLAARFLEDFEQGPARVASRLELQQWRRRSPLEKSREQFWSYFGEIF